MTEKDFRRVVLALDGAIEGTHMGHPDFRAHGRIFATLRGDRPASFGMVVLTPEQQQHFLATSRAFTPESGAWGRAGCTRVRFEDLDEETLGEAVTLAWQNAAAKAAGKKKSTARTTSAETKAAARTEKRPATTSKRAVRR
jgi:hypothetical protein